MENDKGERPPGESEKTSLAVSTRVKKFDAEWRKNLTETVEGS